jgi:hypothetical protein
MKKAKKKQKKEWMVVKAIRFAPDKLKFCKKKGNLSKLPEMCRKQLDLLMTED